MNKGWKLKGGGRIMLKNKAWELTENSGNKKHYDLIFYNPDFLDGMMQKATSFEDLVELNQLLDKIKEIVDSNGKVAIYKMMDFGRLYQSAIVKYPFHSYERDFESLKKGYVQFFDFIQREK